MLTFTAGTDLSIPVALTRNGEPFVADNHVLDWVMYNHAGIAIDSSTDVAAPDSTIFITTVSGNNTISSGHQFEKRAVLVKGLLDGQPFQIRVNYRLTPYLNFTASNDDVRTFIGIDTGELMDDEIDLAAAYYDLAAIVTTDALNTALASGTITELIVNRAIVGQAVLNLIPSFQARLSKSASDGTSSVDRFDLDFTAIANEARIVRDLAVGTLLVTPELARIRVAAGSRTDPLTGN